jgi:phospholipase/lecithinase/hemolysin
MPTPFSFDYPHSVMQVKTSLRPWAKRLMACTSVVLIAACGGGGSADGPHINGVISFGDSFSDAGTYANVTTVKAVSGGRYTTNQTNMASTNLYRYSWPEWMGNFFSLNLSPSVTVNDAGVENLCQSSTCTLFAQGGAGISGAAYSVSGYTPASLTAQFNTYKTTFGTFKSTNIVLVSAGTDELIALTKQVENATLTEQQASDAAASAATQLLTLLGQMGNAGANYLYVTNVIDLTKTPWGKGLSTSLQTTLNTVQNRFNQTLSAGLAAQAPKAKLVDMAAFFNSALTAPADQGLSTSLNFTDVACDATKISTATNGAVTDGNALYCNVDTLVTSGADQTYFFADGVHWTSIANKAFYRYISRQMISNVF